MQPCRTHAITMRSFRWFLHWRMMEDMYKVQQAIFVLCLCAAVGESGRVPPRPAQKVLRGAEVKPDAQCFLLPQLGKPCLLGIWTETDFQQLNIQQRQTASTCWVAGRCKTRHCIGA